MATGVPLNDRQVEKILAYKANGLTEKEIAKALDIPAGSINGVIQRFMPTKAERKSLEIWKSNKAEILSIFQRKFLYGITDEQIAAMTVPQRMMAFGILFDKERLLRGQPTSISLIGSVIRQVRDKQKEISDRIASLKRANVPGDTDQ